MFHLKAGKLKNDMRKYSCILRYSTVVLLFITLITSCSKEEETVSNSYYVSKSVATSYTTEYIKSLIDFVSPDIPELLNIKPFVANDITVYKMVYKTTIAGEEIYASGLVCVPASPGDYPVLSFQNGTNTLNSYAPSEFPLNSSYQLVEIIASMGYIVVFADYPGFGEAVNIPHPYLVKEPTVTSLVDMLFGVKELVGTELKGVTVKNEYYLLGYSQGGWATLALHKALETDYNNDFNLKGSACGAGPYDIYLLLQNMVNLTDYPMPVYIGYIINGYTSYQQFTNPVTDILKEPYAGRLSSLYTGQLSSGQINDQLTTTVSDLLTSDFLSGFSTSDKYSSVREALINNSITAWHSYKPLLFIHGGNDTFVNPVSTESMYASMIEAGTSQDICTKIIVPGVDHGDGLIPCMMQAIMFLQDLKTSE
jgi:pimeloyl-ACP methyl ester carboxylesterase